MLFSVLSSNVLMSCLIAFLTAYLLCFLGMPKFINKMKSLKKEQPIRLNGPQTHLTKKGTPTMGGIVILLSTLVSVLLWCPLTNGFLWILIFVMLSMGLLGFYDDFCKLKSSSPNGISENKRLLIEFIVATIAILFAMYLTPTKVMTALQIPYFKTVFGLSFLYVVFAAFVFTGTVNAVNLTDGLDGLVSVPLIISFICFAILGIITGDLTLARRVSLFYIPDVWVISIFASASCGALLAFLYYNKKPAQIFMGDIGALGMGAVLGMMAICLHQELLLAIIGSLFVIEALSDVIQVFSYKRFKKRIFLMAPIHHHFEKKGWSEVKVVRCFWLFSFFMGLIGLATLL
ncbi:MAG: phospho-N-acetylmuramoyl-pentapeptide-transferase [Alphaproteobacteria bacterium]|nr:phospho-N-acetylmuramoyl-pentapeptide-transferase [Alphaproteobacteria bacterium]